MTMKDKRWLRIIVFILFCLSLGSYIAYITVGGIFSGLQLFSWRTWGTLVSLLLLSIIYCISLWKGSRVDGWVRSTSIIVLVTLIFVMSGQYISRITAAGYSFFDCSGLSHEEFVLCAIGRGATTMDLTVSCLALVELADTLCMGSKDDAQLAHVPTNAAVVAVQPPPIPVPRPPAPPPPQPQPYSVQPNMVTVPYGSLRPPAPPQAAQHNARYYVTVQPTAAGGTAISLLRPVAQYQQAPYMQAKPIQPHYQQPPNLHPVTVVAPSQPPPIPPKKADLPPLPAAATTPVTTTAATPTTVASSPAYHGNMNDSLISSTKLSSAIDEPFPVSTPASLSPMPPSTCSSPARHASQVLSGDHYHDRIDASPMTIASSVSSPEAIAAVLGSHMAQSQTSLKNVDDIVTPVRPQPPRNPQLR